MIWPFKKKAAPTGTLSEPGNGLLALFGSHPTASGQHVSPRSAVRVPAVLAAVRAISESVGTLPVNVYSRGEGNARERDTDHPAHVLLHDRANPWSSATEFRQQVTADALLHGNGYALVVRVNGEPRELHRLDPTLVSIDTDTGEPLYRVQQDGQTVTYSWADILHVRAPLSFDGICGESPVTLAREAIGLALAMEQHGAGLFGNGARPGGVLEHPGKLSPEAADSLREAWRSYTGSGSGGTALLEEGMTFNPLTFKSTDAQYLELRKYAVEEIARAFNVLPTLLHEYGRATWANSEEMRRDFLTFALLPWLRRWEGAIARTLIDDPEQFAEFNVEGFLRADIGKRAEAYSRLIASRILSPNEARAKENLPPYAGGNAFENPNTSTEASNAVQN